MTGNGVARQLKAEPTQQRFLGTGATPVEVLFYRAANTNVQTYADGPKTPALPEYKTEPAQQIERGEDMAREGELRDAEIAAAEARTDTKIARLEGRIDTLSATIVGRFDGLRDDIRHSDNYNRNTRWVLFATVVTAFFALAGLAVTLATYGDALFGRGMNVRDVVQSVTKEVMEQQRRTTPPTQ